MKARAPIRLSSALLLSLILMALPRSVEAHCDALDGPVIQAAMLALEKGDIAPVMKWIAPEHEDAVASTFEMTLRVREEGAEARQLADRHFFETLVRLHRADEGKAFTGIKPAGTIEPVIIAADQALASGSIDGLADELASAVRAAIQTRFEKAHELGKSADDGAESGRAFVAAYVNYVHFIEAVHAMVENGEGHNQGQCQEHGQGHEDGH